MSEDTAPRHLRILHLEDSKLDHDLVNLALRRRGMTFDLIWVETLDAFVEATKDPSIDVVLADYHLTNFTGLDAWEAIKDVAGHPPFIILSGAIGEATAVEAMRRGISDYVLKDNIDKLEYVIWRAIELSDVRRARERADRELKASQQRLAEFTEHLQATIEHERAAIAREIHDDIGGALAAMKFDLAWISRHSKDEAMINHAQAASDMLQHALGASQRIMMNLRPAILDQGLVAAIQWLAFTFERRTNVKVAVRSSSEMIDVSKEIQLVAYRTAQEALTNISKYAECSEVNIDVSDRNDVLTIEVHDNGKGIAAESLSKPRAFGIKGLHERAKTVGGWLDVSSMVDNGTSVILTVPLHDAPLKKAAQ